MVQWPCISATLTIPVCLLCNVHVKVHGWDLARRLWCTLKLRRM